MRYLLDTNIVSDLIRNPGGAVSQRIGDVGDDKICTSIIVAAELRFGAEKRGSARLTERMEQIFELLEILPFDEPADAAYGTVRARLEAAGTPIGSNDLLIAAQGMALGYTIVTDNEREFARVQGLLVENWLRRN